MTTTLLLISFLLVLPQEPDVAPEIAKWEKNIAEIENRDKTEAGTENAILFCGSSSVRRWETIAEDMAPRTVLQRGYGGAKLPDMIHYAPRLIGPHLGKENPRRCKALVLFVGNDISGNPEKDKTPQEVTRSFETLKNWIREKDETVPIFWIEVTPTPKRWQVWPPISDATGRIRQIANADPNCHVVETAGAILGKDGRPQNELFVDDRLHLSEKGYQLWSSLIKAQLYAKLGSETENHP